MRDLDKTAVEAAEDPDLLDQFLLEQEPFILRCASKSVKRFISRSDDEWSVSIEAFCQAVAQYSFNKGNFLSFARMTINRRLIDYYRLQSKYHNEIPVNPRSFTGELDEDEPYTLIKDIPISDGPENDLKAEIEAVNAQLMSYGFSIYDLVRCSPKSYKTKKACLSAVGYMLSKPGLCAEMQKTNFLPIKPIQEYTKIPRKTLERHRKYIIAATEIMLGDYPGLSEYIRPFEEEQPDESSHR